MSESITKHGHPGTVERVLSDLDRYMSNPDSPMVKPGVGNGLSTAMVPPVTPNKMYEDGGWKMSAVRALARHSADAVMPRDAVGVWDALEGFLMFCSECKLPPTIGGFAVWCGVSLARVNQIERDKADERSEAIAKAKEVIRNFLEIAAMDSSINPIIYFHHNKVYFGAIENNAQVNVRIEDNSRDLTPDEYNERVLLLKQNADGSYGPEST